MHDTHKDTTTNTIRQTTYHTYHGIARKIRTTACMTRTKIQPQIQLDKQTTYHTYHGIARNRRTAQQHYTLRVYNTYHSMHDTHKSTATNTIIQTQNVSYIPQQHYTHCVCTIHTTACMTRTKYKHRTYHTYHISTIHTAGVQYIPQYA